MQKLVLISVPEESRPQESAALLICVPLAMKLMTSGGHIKNRFLSPSLFY